MCQVVNLRNLSDEEIDSPDVVYIGRGSEWGNPYVIGEDGTRADVIVKYKRLLWNFIKSGSITKEDLIRLDSKKLACYCAPLACHGNIIKLAVQWAKEQ